MNSLVRLFDRRARIMAAAFAVLLATIIPALVFADQVTERSIQLSSSSAGATGVTYKVSFKAVQAAGAFVVDFCKTTPLIGETCVVPTGFDVGTPTSVTSGFTDVAEVSDDANNNTLRVTGTIAAGANISVDIAGIKNPTDAGALYARIVTYTDATDANGYTSTDPDVVGDHLDEGGVALSITPTVGVSGAVLESMTFCVAGNANPAVPANPITTGSCNGGAALPAPTVKLGNTVGDVTVLDDQDVYEGSIYTQISTNAASGAVVNLKSNTTGCGGLARVGAATFAQGCGIAPALAAGISDGQALFGVKTGTAAGVGTSNGTLRPYNGAGGYYNDSTFKLNWVSGDASGVTGPYGDPFLDTNSLPINNMGMTITFGASAANNTPAGRYSADLSLIATGKF